MAIRRTFFVTLLAILVAVVWPGAGAAVPTTAQGDRLQVMASFDLLADVVGNVAGDAADVETLIPLGVNAHVYEPSAQDIVRLSKADLVFMVGLNFEERLQDVVHEAAEGKVYELWSCQLIRPVLAGLGHEHEHEHEAEHEHAHGEEMGSGSGLMSGDLDALCADHWQTVRAAFGLDDLLTPGAVTYGDPAYAEVLDMADPHVWTDPVNVALWTLMIRDMLSAQDPANAAIYAANAEAYVQKLAALHADLAEQFASLPAERRYLVTNHESISYMAARYGLTVVGVVLPGGGTANEPSVQEMLALVQTVRQYNIPAIFIEITVSDSLARQIATEAGVKVVPLFHSLSAPEGPASTYLDYMRYNAAQIVEALS
ncbi:MAG: metal ABC transporter solute-binding protein, Zn/Mn family [Aggregatilineaceae bacterium]